MLKVNFKHYNLKCWTGDGISIAYIIDICQVLFSEPQEKINDQPHCKPKK